MVRGEGMRLQGVQHGRLYCTDGRTVLMEQDEQDLDPIEQLPLPGTLPERLTYYALTTPHLKPAIHRLLGVVTTVNVWPVSQGNLMATVGADLFRSTDGGRTWQLSRHLQDSSGPMGVLPTALCSHDGTIYLGEYPLDTEATPRILRSDDSGRSWSTAVSLPDVRHIHAIQRDPYTNDLWVTTGDTDREARIGLLRDGRVETIGGGSQRWRAVELAFTPSAILWGMDCDYAEHKRIFKLPRERLDAETPTPDPVSQVPGAVFYSTSLTVDGDVWVIFSTSIASGPDSTGPAVQRSLDERAVVVGASSATGYTKWHELASFRRRRCLADHLPGTTVPTSNSYIFLDSDPSRGVFINPYNTTSDGIYRIAPERLGASHSR